MSLSIDWNMALAGCAALLIGDCSSPNVFGFFRANPDWLAQYEIIGLVWAVKIYGESQGVLPRDLRELVDAGLVEADEAHRLLFDPWQRPYEYQIDSQLKDGFVVISRGQDPQSDEDDLRSDRFPKSP